MSSGRVTETSSYGAGIARLNDIAKWTIGALAAVATAMLAGSQLSSIGSLPSSPRLFVAGAAALLAVVLVILGIYLVSRVLVLPTGGVGDLTEKREAVEKRLDPFLASDGGFLEGRKDVAHLVTHYRESQRAAIKAARSVHRLRKELAWGKGDERSARTGLAQATKVFAAHEAELTVLRQRVYALVDLNRYLVVKEAFSKAMTRLVVVAVAVAACLITFAWAANPPEAEPAPETPTEAASFMPVPTWS